MWSSSNVEAMWRSVDTYQVNGRYNICDRCPANCPNEQTFDEHYQTKHPRCYWPMLHDSTLPSTKFPLGVFYCGLCSTSYRDQYRCRVHLVDRHPGVTRTLSKDDMSEIVTTDIHRCPHCTFWSEIETVVVEHISSCAKASTTNRDARRSANQPIVIASGTHSERESSISTSDVFESMWLKAAATNHTELVWTMKAQGPPIPVDHQDPPSLYLGPTQLQLGSADSSLVSLELRCSILGLSAPLLTSQWHRVKLSFTAHISCLAKQIV
ncbi:unnamed protein product [Penicillium bialowiezense]